MNKFSTKLCVTYFTGMNIYGFYRGFTNKYKSNSIFNSNSNTLYVDKTISGLLSIGYYINPLFHPIIIYYIIKRTEKQIRCFELTEDDWEY